MQSARGARLRFAFNDASCHYASEFLAMDECLEVLEQRDAQLIQEEQSRFAAKSGAWDRFKADYQAATKGAHAERAAAAAPGPAGKARKKSHKKTPVEANIAHGDDARFMPPGGRVWQRRQYHAWGAHVPPRPRISEPWGEDCGCALHRIGKRAWTG